MIRTFTIIMLICFNANLIVAQSEEKSRKLDRPKNGISVENSFLTKISTTQLKGIKQNNRLVSLNFNASQFRNLTAKKYRSLEVEIPGIEDLSIELDLAPVTITSDDFTVSNLADKSQ